MNDNSKKAQYDAMKKVQAASFAVDEARLYLDMHPDDAKALKYFDAKSALRHKAISEYQKQFGPISTEHINASSDGWTWICGEQPWEMGV